MFPKHDAIGAGEFGNAIRGPLGIHRGAKRRFWFYGADYTLEDQIAYLNRLRKVTEEELRKCLARKDIRKSESAARPERHVPREDKADKVGLSFAFWIMLKRCARQAAIMSRAARPALSPAMTGAATTWPS